LGAQAPDPALADAKAGVGQLVGDEAVPKGRVVVMDVEGGVDEMRLVPVTLRDWVSPPLAWVEKPSTRQVTVTANPSAARSRTSG